MHTHNRRSQFDVRAELYRVLGVDLTQVPGLQSGSALVLFTELGPDFSTKFPTAKCFASWLGLCPDTLGHVWSSSRDSRPRILAPPDSAPRPVPGSSSQPGLRSICPVCEKNHKLELAALFAGG